MSDSAKEEDVLSDTMSNRGGNQPFKDQSSTERVHRSRVIYSRLLSNRLLKNHNQGCHARGLYPRNRNQGNQAGSTNSTAANH